MRILMHRGAVMAAAAGLLVAGIMAAVPEAAGAAVISVTGVKAPLPANAGSDPGVAVTSVSCTSAGNCTAVGGYSDKSGSPQGFLLTQTSGRWATGLEAPLPTGAAARPLAYLSSVSCASAGDCTAVGDYYDSAGNLQGVLLTQTSGKWAATEAPLPAGAASNPDVLPNSVSCASAGNCTAVGDYRDSVGNLQGVLLTQTSGRWAAAEAPVPAGVATNHLVPNSVSCASAGNCAAVGWYTDGSGNNQGLLLIQTSGSWAASEAPVPANAATQPDVILSSVSCAPVGNCTAVGDYTDSSNNRQALLLTHTSATWAAAEAPVPANAASDPFAIPDSVSCASASNCTTAGYYNDSSGNIQGLLLTHTSGRWAAAEAPLPVGASSRPFVYLAWVSCASAGNCTAVGDYNDSSRHRQGVLLTQTSGRWAAGVKAPLPAGASTRTGVHLISVSCGSAGNCTVGGYYNDSSGNTQGLLVTEKTG